MPTNTKESDLEELIVNSLVHENGCKQGGNKDYNRDYAIDKACFSAFSQKLRKILMMNEAIWAVDKKFRRMYYFIYIFEGMLEK
jgi:hypothetical protein